MEGKLTGIATAFDPRTTTTEGDHPSFSMGDRVVFNEELGKNSINIAQAIYGPGPFKVAAVVNHDPIFAKRLGIHPQQVFIEVGGRGGRPSCQFSSVWFKPATEGAQ